MQIIDKKAAECYNDYMDIIVFSDSHGRSDNISAVFENCPRMPDAVIFLGDGLRDLAWSVPQGIPIYSVKGNCDFYGDEETELIIKLGGKTIFATHGHKYGVKLGYGSIYRRAAEAGADILLFGHTHEAFLETVTQEDKNKEDFRLEKDLFVMNPGSIGYDRSFGTVVIKDGQILTSLGRL